MPQLWRPRHQGTVATGSWPARRPRTAGRPSLRPIAWEFDQRRTLAMMKSARSIAVDMESATIAANGFLYRIPNATLLCVSDKPLHADANSPVARNPAMR